MKLSEIMARGVLREEQRGKSPDPSMSHGPVVVLKGWRKGMDKGGVTLKLHDYGLPLSVAHAATNSILDGKSVTLRFPEKSDLREIRHQLTALGVIL
jgi:hypothetical protein